MDSAVAITTVQSTDSTSLPCPKCGTEVANRQLDDSAQESQQRISELESQVKILTEKAADAVDKLADYEDELRRSRSEHTQTLSTSSQESKPTPPPKSGSGALGHLQKQPSTTGRLSNFLNSRRGSPSLDASQNNTSAAREHNLNNALSQERTLRKEAEGKLEAMNTDMEELSSSLFQQANEMVATERKARAKLEERAAKFEQRCGTLEEKVKILERRDNEKRNRLEKLEEAVKRIERVRRVIDVR